MSPEFAKQTSISYKQGGGSWSLKLSKSSDYPTVGFFRRIKAKFVSVFPFVSTNRRSSARVSSPTLERSHSCAYTPIDSHRAEAIDDCIQFLNASSSFHRSNSQALVSYR